MNRLSKKELIFISVVVIMGFIVLFSYIFIRNDGEQTGRIPEVTTPPVSSSDPIPSPSITVTPAPEINVQDIESVKKRLPYTGQYFILDFDQENNVFFYTYNRNFYQAALNELNQFLEENNLNREILDSYGLESYFY